MRIQRAFDRAHQIDGFSVLPGQQVELVPADAVLAGAGAAHRNGTHAHRLRQRFGTIARAAFHGIEQNDKVKIAVAYMAQNRRDEPAFLDVRLGLQDAVGQSRYGNARVGGEAGHAGLERQRGVVRVVARFP